MTAPVAMLGRMLDDVDVVSFDFFDTLVHRPSLYAPTSLFHLIDEAAVGEGLSIKEFPSVRIRGEAIARVRAQGHGVGDVTLPEIYREVGVLARFDEAETATLLGLELAAERRVIQMLPSGRALYGAAVDAGKRIAIVSDTYFSVEFLTELAERAGYVNIEWILASSVERATKAQGGLFDRLLERTGAPAGRVVHVGDDAYSDYRGALGRGLRAVLTSTPMQAWKRARSVPNRTTGARVLDDLLVSLASPSSRSETCDDTCDDTGLVPEVAVLYLGHALWLASQLVQSRIRTVYFFSRDGQIMKEFFDLVSRAAGLGIESRYLHVSRAALYPTVIFTSPETARRLFAHNWDHLPIAHALRRVGLDPDESQDALRAAGLRADAVLGAASRDRFESTLVRLWPLIERRNAAASECAIAYLEQEAVLTTEHSAFVDIGWHGTMQNAIVLLCRHLGIVKPVNGYYLGTFDQPVGADRSYRASGFLVDNDNPPDIRAIVRASPSVIELLHGADHGSVERYEPRDGRVAPVLADDADEREQHRRVIAPIQHAALARARAVLGGDRTLRASAPDPGMVARVGLGWLTKPTPAVAEALGSLRIASDVRGVSRSVTGVIEHGLEGAAGEMLPDGSRPMWPAGRRVLGGQ